jgi:hypothetical protein
MFRTHVLLTLVVAAACATPRPALAESQAFASSAVLLEMSETRPAFNSLNPYEQSQVHIWLLANCAVDADTRRMELVKLGSFGELALLEAFGMGPPVTFLAELAASRRNDFAAIQERLAGEDREMFDDYLREQVKAISEKSYVNEGIDLTILSYRLSALDGIATVGTNTSIAWLERTSPKLESPELRRAAERALDALRQRCEASKS